jgi:tetrahydromethanopterin S-methyltransferase subunit D
LPTISTLPAASGIATADRFPFDHANGDGTYTTQSASGAQIAGLASAASTYTFNQATPLAVWTITHGLGRFPSVVVVDSSGSTVEGDVVYNSSNQVTLSFGGAFSGVAYLN